MSNKNLNLADKIDLKTKIYLLIIAIILIVLCINNKLYIIPSILIYLALIIYALLTAQKRKDEISNYISELTISVDSAAKNTLINSPFPLIILETDGNVIWRSANFNKEFATVGINKYIDEISKEVKVEIENNKTTHISKIVKIEDKTYNIIGDCVKIKQKDRKKENKYMVILYFVDITEKEELLKNYNDSQTCIGIIMIDNYEDTFQRISAEEKPQVMAQIEKKLYDWAMSSKGLIIKTERDTFIYVFNQEFLNQMQEEKFSILDEIKEIKNKEKMQITLSIAVSNQGETNYEKYEEAQDAMDIALRKRRRSSSYKARWKIFILWRKNSRSGKKNKSKSKNGCTCFRRINIR